MSQTTTAIHSNVFGFAGWRSKIAFHTNVKLSKLLERGIER